MANGSLPKSSLLGWNSKRTRDVNMEHKLNYNKQPTLLQRSNSTHVWCYGFVAGFVAERIGQSRRGGCRSRSVELIVGTRLSERTAERVVEITAAAAAGCAKGTRKAMRCRTAAHRLGTERIGWREAVARFESMRVRSVGWLSRFFLCRCNSCVVTN